MKWIVLIIQALLMAVYFMTGFAKLGGDPVQTQAFTEIYGYGVWFMYVVGILEVMAALGLLLGFWKRNLAIWASGLVVLIMAGAIMTHLQAGQGYQIALFPFILLLLAAFVLWGQRQLSVQRI